MGSRDQQEQREQRGDELDEARMQIADLQAALVSARRIGAATGIVMTQRGVGYDQAFEMLREASQQLNRKIRDLAEDVIYTVQMPDVPPRPRLA